MKKRKDFGFALKYLPHVLIFGLGVAATVGFQALAKVRQHH